MEILKNIIGNIFDLQKDRAPLSEIAERIYSGGTLKGTNMCILILAIFIASIGLNMNSTAVIIGAMLISPLMGVIMSIGYGMATYDSSYVKESFWKLVFQVILSVLTSALYFSLSPIDTASSELLARTEPTIWDVLIAVFGGLAGIIGSTRSEKSNVIPGVAIATALMPPLCTAGYGLAHHSLKFFFGALYLFFINSFFICLTTFLVLKLIKVPAKAYVSEQAFKKQRWGLTALGILIVLPSMYMAYHSVNANLEQVQIQTFIEKNFHGNDLQVVSYNINEPEQRLELTIIGRTVTADEKDTFEEGLSAYSRLAGFKLHIIQNDFLGSVQAEDLQNILDPRWRKMGGISYDELQDEVKKYKEHSLTYAPAYKRLTEDKNIIANINKKAPILFPQFKTIEGAAIPSEDDKGQVVYSKFFALAYLTGELNEEEQKRFQQWLDSEVGMPVKVMLQVVE
ncbi:MAG: DUF389 domain-containing protein [Anaerovibrio sp.]|nr:DUF389 domain-containing protein [Anaerovibrio sp.]